MNSVEYLGGLITRGVHEETGAEVKTAAAKAHGGDGSAFTPIDLLCTSVGACMLTIIGMGASAHGFSIDGAKVSATADMGDKIGRLQSMDFTVDCRSLNLNKKQQDIVVRSAQTCPVVLSLHPEVKVNSQFIFE